MVVPWQTSALRTGSFSYHIRAGEIGMNGP